MSATTMQPNRLKAACLAVLQRNRECNTDATEAKEACNSKAFNPPQKLHAVAEVANHQDVHRLIGETLREIDRAGRPWPRDYYKSLPTETLERLRALMQEVEQCALADDIAGTANALTEWWLALTKHLH